MAKTIHNDPRLLAMYKDQLDECDSDNDWEADFLNSLRNQLDSKRGLSGSQAEVLGRIWNRSKDRKRKERS